MSKFKNPLDNEKYHEDALNEYCKLDCYELIAELTDRFTEAELIETLSEIITEQDYSGKLRKRICLLDYHTADSWIAHVETVKDFNTLLLYTIYIVGVDELSWDLRKCYNSRVENMIYDEYFN